MTLMELIGVGALAVLLLFILNRSGLRLSDVGKIVKFVKKERTK